MEQRRASHACESSCESGRTLGSGKMDEDVTSQNAAETVPVRLGPAATEEGPRDLSINELEKLDDLFPLAADFNLHLHPARTRHYHVLDIARAALGQGANVTAEGF